MAAGSSTPASFGKKAADLGYDIQDALYRRIVGNLLPGARGHIKFANLAVESAAPHGHAILFPDGETRQAAAMDVDLAVSIWARCMATRRFPAYPREPQTYSTPNWRKQRATERAYMTGDDE